MLDLELETVELQLRERVAWITLNRPGSLNAFTPQMGRELLAVLDHVASDPGVRALALTGAGRGFSSGADLREVASWGADGRPELLTPLRQIFHPLILRLRTIEQ
ncbi:MAG: enoyl-CoA hydratase/isomerase family protein, partial [Acidobacteriota bacterium]|nr:enoyl-CoA hydratase/isomerase family protein [Acidobacteriota bacterium]